MNSERFEGLSLPELLALLHDPVAPVPVAWWPQTVGWLVVAGWLLAVSSIVGWHAWQRWRHNRYRREALALLASAAEDAEAVATILKRVALARYPRREVASLYGDAWAAFLVQSGGGDRLIANGVTELVAAAYRRQPLSPTAVAAAARWVRIHD